MATQTQKYDHNDRTSKASNTTKNKPTPEDKLYKDIIQTDKNVKNKKMHKNYNRMGRESICFEILEKNSFIFFPFHF